MLTLCNAARAILAGFLTTVSYGGTARAAEMGVGAYTLGQRGASAGVLPPPGTYVLDQFFSYSGDFTGVLPLSSDTTVPVHVDAALALNLVSLIRVFPWTMAGGTPGVSMTVPVGQVQTELSSHGLTPATSISSEATSLGDPSFTSFIGWQTGQLHSNFSASVTLPAGAYRQARFANIALNRPAVDFSAAVSWLPKRTPLDISLASGLTFNGENSATNYRTGVEWHFEWAIGTQLTSTISTGFSGYGYKQLTPDRQYGLQIDNFEGQVYAAGGYISYQGLVGANVISVRLQAMQEFDVRNRLKGVPAAFVLTVPF
jgi:hypothetical protein